MSRSSAVVNLSQAAIMYVESTKRTDSPTSSDDVDAKPELSGDSSVARKTMAELDDQAESREMEGDALFPELAHLIKSSELEVPRKVHELPG